MATYFTQAQLEMEVKIETGRILTVLDTTLANLELALRMPTLLRDNLSRLRPFLRDDELEIVAKCNKQRRRTVEVNELGEQTVRVGRQRMQSDDGKKIASRVTIMAAAGDSFHNVGAKKYRLNPELCRAIHLLCSKPKRLKKIVRQAELSDQAATFIGLLRRLRDFVEIKLNVSPVEEEKRNKELRLAWRNNEKAKDEITALRQKLTLCKRNADATLTTKTRIIDKHKYKIAKIISDSKQDCKKIVADSERRMVAECKLSEFRKSQLSQDGKLTNAKLNALLAEHLQSEKDLRAKRFKIETQLASWLEKYDSDIGEKQAEWEEVEEGFNKEKKQMAILQDQFDDQEEEYEILMAEKEEEYQRELDAKMYVFLWNRAARRIQRYWRAYRERKLARKKTRRSKRAKSPQPGRKGPKTSGKKKK